MRSYIRCVANVRENVRTGGCKKSQKTKRENFNTRSGHLERMLKHRNKGCLFHLIVAFLMCFLHDMAFAFADEGDPTARFTNKELFEGIKKIALEHKNGGKRSPEYVPAVWKSSPIPVKIISLSESSSIERVRRSIDNINGDLWGTIFLRVVEVASSSRNFFHNGQFVLKNTSPLIFGINIFIVEKDADTSKNSDFGSLRHDLTVPARLTVVFPGVFALA